jgi:hypothetical protein
MPFTFKLSKRLALLKPSFIVASAALALACERTDLSAPEEALSSPLTQVVSSLSGVTVVASAHDGNLPQNTLDQNPATRWAAHGDGQWIRYDLGALKAVGRVAIAWFRGNEWASAFDIEVSPDAVTWTRVFAGRSGRTPEGYEFPTVAARYLRIVGHGQWSGTTRLSLWISIAEIAIYEAEAELPMVAVAASAHDGNVPQNTLDNNPVTRWSALGDGQWIRYDLGALQAVGRVDIAWYLGNAWASAFDIEVSSDTVTWTRVFAGRSSGLTLQPERYDFPTAAGRYVRIVGHGQWRGTTRLSLWTSITEAAIHGSAAATTPPPPAPAPAAVATVAVSPASSSVSLGATIQLSAVVKDANGYLLSGRSVNWTSSTPAVATVSASGLVTGLVIGSATITATSEGKSGTAVLTVASAGAGAGPQPGPTSTIIFQDGFESGNLSLWEQITATGRYSITTNAARVKSGTRAMQTLYTPANGYGMITRWFMPGYDEVYVRFHVMFDAGFQNMRDDGHGMHFFVIGGNRIDNSRSSFGTAGRRPNGTDFFYAGIDPEYIQRDPTLRPFSYYTYWPDMPGSYGSIRTQAAPKAPLIGGQWQEVVFHIKMNTPGQYNGSQTVWINGVKKLEQQNMRWRTTTDLRINQIRLDNYMPGGLKTQYMWMDDVMVWRP